MVKTEDNKTLSPVQMRAAELADQADRHVESCRAGNPVLTASCLRQNLNQTEIDSETFVKRFEKEIVGKTYQLSHSMSLVIWGIDADSLKCP